MEYSKLINNQQAEVTPACRNRRKNYIQPIQPYTTYLTFVHLFKMFLRYILFNTPPSGRPQVWPIPIRICWFYDRELYVYDIMRLVGFYK